jgi:opacity protein-like surface antigen
MKKIAIACVLAAVSFPTVSFADTKNFEGFSAGLNLNMISGGFDLNDGQRTFLGGKQAISAGLDFAYGFSMSQSGVLTVGLDADVTSPETFSTTEDSLSFKQKNRYGIYIAPGTLINKDTLVYGKVGYNSMKGEFGFPSGQVSNRYSGAGYGFGVKTIISPQVFLKVEVNRYTFGSELVDGDTVKPAATVGVLGIGTSF